MTVEAPIEVVVQCISRAAKRQVLPWDLLLRERPDLQRLVAVPEGAADWRGSVDNNDRDPVGVGVDAD